MINIEDKLNEATMKCNSLTAIVEEKTEMVDKYMQKNKEQFEERLHPDQKTCDNAAKLFLGETK